MMDFDVYMLLSFLLNLDFKYIFHLLCIVLLVFNVTFNNKSVIVTVSCITGVIMLCCMPPTDWGKSVLNQYKGSSKQGCLVHINIISLNVTLVLIMLNKYSENFRVIFLCSMFIVMTMYIYM